MRRPWQIWFLYFGCLAIVVPAMAWLTLKAWELDAAEQTARLAAEQARRQAELQELASSALWRMDWTLTPLIAQEAARPYFVYQSFYESVGGDGGKTPSVRVVPSPLLIQPSEYVLLNFQVSPRDQWSSPQNPVGMMCTPALENGATLESIRFSAERLADLQARTGYSALLGRLPEQMLPQFEPQQLLAWQGNQNVDPLRNFESQLINDLGLRQTSDSLQPPLNVAPGEPRQDTPRQAPSMQAQSPQARSPQVSAPPDSPRQAADELLRQQAPMQQQAEPRQQQSAAAEPQLRSQNEWQRRNQAYQTYATNTVLQQRVTGQEAPEPGLILEGVSRPVWVGDALLLARRAVLGEQVMIQGCWLNWPRIKSVLLAEITDLLPDADLRPVTNGQPVPPGRLLATLPVQLVVSAEDRGAGPLVAEQRMSAMQFSLLMAWTGLLLAAAAVAVLLRGVIGLSERRAAFVSAVTHELRTPLTTFRIYAEMLSGGMVEGAERTRLYLETLRVEADRLTHLVDNVLQYARLERGSRRRRGETLSVGQLVERVACRLRERAEQAGMELHWELPPDVAECRLTTDPSAVEQILFNLVDNACKYAAAADDRRIQITLGNSHGRLTWSVRDYGPGIAADQRRRLFRPFSKSADEAARTAPGVGLGLALCQRLAGDLGGSLRQGRAEPVGACLVLQLPLNKSGA
ncbi:MAG: HAMP domain-containing histidine kinase [Pirellulaceae bacterium]|nr:HAMP domain-containing histidine kinase [Pirellulaceae bacterium]